VLVVVLAVMLVVVLAVILAVVLAVILAAVLAVVLAVILAAMLAVGALAVGVLTTKSLLAIVVVDAVEFSYLQSLSRRRAWTASLFGHTLPPSSPEAAVYRGQLKPLDSVVCG
jgi:hypothetical protein